MKNDKNNVIILKKGLVSKEVNNYLKNIKR